CGELSPSRIRERPARACPNSPSRTKGVSGYSRFSGPMATGFSSANSWCARRYEDDPLPARCLGNNLVPALVQGPSRLEPHHEYTQGHRAGREKRVADDAQPAQGIHRIRLHEFRGAGVPKTMLHARPGLEYAHWEEAQERHQRQSPVDGPECEPDQPVLPDLVGRQASQDEKHQTDAQYSVNPEQGGVAMQRRGVQSLHVIKRDGRVYEEPEYAGADQVPERH